MGTESTQHTDVRDRTGAVMSDYEHTCLIRGDGGRTLRAILDQICNKWTLLIVATLDQRTLRFADLHQQVAGISQRRLTLTLRNLERDGLVVRTVHAQVPPRVEYALTPTGRSLLPPRAGAGRLGHRARPPHRGQSRRLPDPGRLTPGCPLWSASPADCRQSMGTPSAAA
jgi:DNA-binding HxlR family transcriptional regulator